MIRPFLVIVFILAFLLKPWLSKKHRISMILYVVISWLLLYFDVIS